MYVDAWNTSILPCWNPILDLWPGTGRNLLMIDGYFFWNGPKKKLNVWISQSEHEFLDIYMGIYRDQYPNLTGWSPASCECKNRDFSHSDAACSTGAVFPFEDALMSVHDSMCALLRMLCQAGLAIVINPNDMRDGKKGWWRILHVSSLLSWKWLQTMESDIVNYQKRYLAIFLKTNTSCRFACKPLNAMWSIVVLSFSSSGPLLKRYTYIYI